MRRPAPLATPTMMLALLLVGGLLWGQGCLLGFNQAVETDDDDVGTVDDDDAGGDDDDTVSDDDDTGPGDDDDDDTVSDDDWDGDGVPNGGDCEPMDPNIYPGALETPCDGGDNDCNGEPHPYEVDDDGDGQSDCDGDCNDNDADIFPGQVEVTCDGIDQDCDGTDDCDETPEPTPDPTPDPTVDPCAVAESVDAASIIGVPILRDLDTTLPMIGNPPTPFLSFQVTGFLSPTYVATLSALFHDPVLQLYDPSCNLIATETGAAFGAAAETTWSPGIGETYTLVATWASTPLVIPSTFTLTISTP